MGNRAVITTEHAWANDGIGIYLHWNGGRDSVEAFREYCKLKGYRSPNSDESYGMARLCQVISNFFGGSTSVGIGTLWQLDCDNYDNGVYILRDWEIVGRAHFSGCEQNEYELEEMLIAIDEAQPESEQLGRDFITAEDLPRVRLKLGDKVYVPRYGSGDYEVHEIIGFGDREPVNGGDIEGIPYVDMFGRMTSDGEMEYAWNINNYLRASEYRVVRDE